MVPGTLVAELREVEPLLRGKTAARETNRVRSIPPAHVEPVLPLLSRQVKAMVELQLITAMRPGEVCAMRTCDIDTTTKPWTYRPAAHKTEHHGHERIIHLGPKAQAIVAPLLKPDTQAHIFSPAETEVERREAVRAKRKTPAHVGNAPGTNHSRPREAGARKAVHR